MKILFIVALLIPVIVSCDREQMTTHKFYNDVDTVFVVEMPKTCNANELIVEHGENLTMICPDKTYGYLAVMQPLIYFPYLRIYECYFTPADRYEIISECSHGTSGDPVGLLRGVSRALFQCHRDKCYPKEM